MKARKIVAVIVSVLILAGCSSKPEDLGKPYVQDKSKSFALNLAAYAGYPGILEDNNYSHSLDALSRAGTMAVLLPNDLGASMGGLGAGALGFGLGMVTSLADLVPLDSGYIFTAKLQPGEDYRSPDTVLRVIKANFELRGKYKYDDASDAEMLKKTSLDRYVCKPTTDYGYDVTCYDPDFENYNYYVNTTRPANGQEFGDAMPLPFGNYGVYFISAGRTGNFVPKKQSVDIHFSFENGVYTSGDGKIVMPRVGPREDGKRLVIIDGKAKFL